MPAASDPLSVRDTALAEVMQFLSEGVAIFDAESRIKLINPSFRAMYPTLDDIMQPGEQWSIFLREAVKRGAMPKPVGQRLDAIEAALSDDADQSPAMQMPAGKGRVYALRLAASSDGGFVLTQTQRTDRTADTDAARDAELLLRKVLEACPTSLIMSRVADGQILYRSPAATELLGTAKNSFSHFADRRERADFVTLLLPDMLVDNMRVTGLRPDGTRFPAEISARLIDYRGEDVIVANIEDLTKELTVKAEMDRQKEQLFQSEKLSALGELLAAVAHELNNPLSIILGNAEFLHEELEDTGMERRVEKLAQAAHRCVRIVRSFLSLARQEPLDLRPIKPTELIEAAVDAVAAEAETAHIRFVAPVSSHVPAVVADEVQMTQVLINLLTNAVHAIQGAGTGDEIGIACSHDETIARICVTDNGPGVRDDIKTRIFDPLFTTKDPGQGTGVGLAYCHRIITAHQGQISLESIAGQGATFTITLPLANTASSTPAKGSD